MQWDHPHGAVVTEGAVLQESSVSDRPPMAVARWKVERSAGELAASQTAAMRAYPPGRSTTDHGASAGTYHAEAGAVQPQPQSQFLPVQYAADGGGDGLMGLLARESSTGWQIPSELEGSMPHSAVDVRQSGGDPLHMHVRDAHVVHPEVLKDPKVLPLRSDALAKLWRPLITAEYAMLDFTFSLHPVYAVDSNHVVSLVAAESCTPRHRTKFRCVTCFVLSPAGGLICICRS